MITLELWTWGRHAEEVRDLFIASFHIGYILSTGLITGDGTIDHLVKVVSVMALHSEVIILPFILYSLEVSH